MTRVLEMCKIICRPLPSNRATTACMRRIRATFYNQDLFAYDFVDNSSAPTRRLVVGWLDFALNFSVSLAILVILIYFAPSLLSHLLPTWRVFGQQHVDSSQVSLTPYLPAKIDTQFADSETQTPPPEWGSHKVKPTYDLSYPEGRWFISQEAGIFAPIGTNASVENAAEVNAILDQGVYLYPEYSNIGWSGETTVLAGHHFNMAVTPERAAQTFQNLEQLKVGDIVQIVDDYKVWNYEIYKIEQATEITEDKPDLLAYSCIYWWDSKLRLFVYGRVIENPA